MRVICLTVFAGSFVGVRSIVRRSDVADSKYVVDASEHPEIVMINPGGGLKSRAFRSRENGTSSFNVECAGTMITKKHAITAAHCFEDGARQKGFKVKVNGQRLSVVATHFNPKCKFNLKKDGPNQCDTAIVELSDDADITPMPVYHWDDEAGKHMDIYGWGVTGSAATISAKDCDDGSEDEKFRHGENDVERVSTTASGGIIYYTMRKTGGLPLEAISASGDSGGPAYIKGPDGKMYIAGTNSGSNDNNGCRYGSTDQYCRLSRHYDWIQSVIGTTARSPSSPSPTSPGLDAYIKQKMDTGKIPGMSITVLRKDQIVWNGAYGTTKPGVSSAPAVTSDTAFMFASLSKTNIAIASMILYDKGLIHPDDDVNKYVNFTVRNPSFPKVPVTLHNLMTHTASITDSEYDNIPIYMAGDPTISLYEVVYNYLAEGGQWTKTGKTWNKKNPPNKKFEYSNIGACLMAYVCEVVAAKNGLANSFDDFVRDFIYVPLDVDKMKVGYLAKDLASLEPPAYAIPSQFSKNGWSNCDPSYSVMDYPTCDWRSSSLNYARLFGMFMNFGTFQGTQILKNETVQYMQQKSGFASKGEEASNVFFLYEQNLITGYDWVLGHDGSDEGVSTYAYFDPKTRVGYVLLTNGDMDGKGDLDDAAIAIGGKLMETFGAHPFMNDAMPDQQGTITPAMRERHQRRSKVKSGTHGYPGSFHAPGCKDLMTFAEFV